MQATIEENAVIYGVNEILHALKMGYKGRLETGRMLAVVVIELVDVFPGLKNTRATARAALERAIKDGVVCDFGDGTTYLTQRGRDAHSAVVYNAVLPSDG